MQVKNMRNLKDDCDMVGIGRPWRSADFSNGRLSRWKYVEQVEHMEKRVPRKQWNGVGRG